MCKIFIEYFERIRYGAEIALVHTTVILIELRQEFGRVV